jgi:hypothetical protein
VQGNYHEVFRQRCVSQIVPRYVTRELLMYAFSKGRQHSSAFLAISDLAFCKCGQQRIRRIGCEKFEFDGALQCVEMDDKVFKRRYIQLPQLTQDHTYPRWGRRSDLNFIHLGRHSSC